MNKILNKAAWLFAGVLAAKLFWIKLYDPDLWWHMAAGRAMATSGALLSSDIFSHTLNGAPWINFEWLGQIFLYDLMEAGGLPAIFWTKTFLCAAAAGLLIWQVVRSGIRGPLSVLLFWLGFLVLLSRLYERLELATLILLPVFVEFSAQPREFWKGELKARPWILLGLMALWCNLHGGFVYGLAVLLLARAGAQWSQSPANHRRMLNWAVLGCAAATLVNPLGPRLWKVFVEHWADQAALPFILEWQAPSMADLPYFWVLFLISGAVLVRGILKGRSEAKFWAPLVLVFLVWGSRYYRNAALSVSVAIPFLARALKDAAWMKQKSIRWTLWAVSFGCMLMFLPHLLKPVPRGVWKGYLFPTGACDFLKREKIEGRMFNTYEYGGFIEWTLGQDHPVFFDGRYLFHRLLEEQLRTEQAALISGDGGAWKEFMARFGVDHAVVKHNFDSTQGKPLYRTLFPASDWALVYWDDTALVFLQRQDKFRDIIKRLEYKAAIPYDVELTGRKPVLEELARHDQEAGFGVIASEMRKRVTEGRTGPIPAP